MEANRITRYAWWAVGALTCLIALAAMWRLWDAGKAQAQTEPMKEEVTKAEKACPRCKGIKIQFTGTLAKDNNHGWREIHPVRKEQWTDRTGSTHKCAEKSEFCRMADGIRLGLP